MFFHFPLSSSKTDLGYEKLEHQLTFFKPANYLNLYLPFFNFVDFYVQHHRTYVWYVFGTLSFQFLNTCIILGSLNLPNTVSF